MVKFKYGTGQTVWVIMFGKPEFGVIVNKDEEDRKPVYTVRIVDQGADPVKVAMGGQPASVELWGKPEYEVFETKLDAAKRLISRYGTMHHWLGIAIQDCYRNYDNVDYLLERMEKFETMVKEDLP